MSRFFLVVSYNDETQPRDQTVYFAAACKNLGLEFVEINSQTVHLKDVPQLNPGDLLYRNAATNRAKNIEKIMMTSEVATFYKNYDTAFLGRKSSFFQNQKMGIPVIPTYPILPADPTEVLESIKFLGGFPIIIKVMGSSKGVGVIKVDSVESYKSVLDYVRSTGASTIVRKFIHHDYYARLIVVGDKVVSSYKSIVPNSEFRSNTIENTDSNRSAFVFSDEITKVAIDAVKTNGLEFGGVDLIFEKDTDQPYVAEVNFPCQFEYAQRITGIDVAQHMLVFLQNKVTNRQ